MNAIEALRWCVENDGECLGDHPKRLAMYRAFCAAETQRSSHGSEPDEKKGVEAHPAPAGSESTAPICSHCGKPNTLGWTAENVRRGKQFNEATNTLVYHCYERFIED